MKPGARSWKKYVITEASFCFCVRLRIKTYCFWLWAASVLAPNWLFWTFYTQDSLQIFADLCSLFCTREVALWWTLPNLHPKTWLAAGSFPFSQSLGQLDTSLLLLDCGRWFAQRVTKSCRLVLPRACSLLGKLLIIVHDRSDSPSLPRSFFQLGSLLPVLRAWPVRVLVVDSHAQLGRLNERLCDRCTFVVSSEVFWFHLFCSVGRGSVDLHRAHPLWCSTSHTWAASWCCNQLVWVSALGFRNIWRGSIVGATTIQGRSLTNG